MKITESYETKPHPKKDPPRHFQRFKRPSVMATIKNRVSRLDLLRWLRTKNSSDPRPMETPYQNRPPQWGPDLRANGGKSRRGKKMRRGRKTRSGRKTLRRKTLRRKTRKRK